MKIQEKIHEDLIKATLNKDIIKRDLLRVLLAEFERISKTVTEVQAIQTIIRVKKNIEETLELGGPEKVPNAQAEIKILNTYLPDRMSPAQIESALIPIIATLEGAALKDIKAKFDELYPGQDGKIVAQIIFQIS